MKHSNWIGINNMDEVLVERGDLTYIKDIVKEARGGNTSEGLLEELDNVMEIIDAILKDEWSD